MYTSLTFLVFYSQTIFKTSCFDLAAKNSDFPCSIFYHVTMRDLLCYAIGLNRDREERHWRCSTRKKLLAIICGAYLNGCRRNDCCSYDWDNYIVPASWAADTARCERRQDERECRRRSHRPRSKRSCGIDNDINDTNTTISSCTNSLYTIYTTVCGTIVSVAS